MSQYFYTGPNRYLCSVLEEMRNQLKLLDNKNIDVYRSITAMQIEEVQSLGNRMEAALDDISDMDDLTEKYRQLKADIRRLKREKTKLNTEEPNE